MILYGLKNCDTCRKARKMLDGVDFRDVREDGVPVDLLERALAEFGDKVVNTRSTTWRSLSEEARALPPLELLRTHPSLMKRPLIVNGSQLVLGWDKAAQAALGV